MFKKLLILLLVFVMCMSGTANVFAADNKAVGIELNGKAVQIPAKVLEGELFLPLRAVSEELGYQVQWFGHTEKTTVTKSGKNIDLSLPDSKLCINGHEDYIAGGHRLVNNRTYLRQDFFSDNLGLKVIWDKAGNKVILQEVDENPLIINNWREDSETNTLKLTLQYPELSGLDNTEVQERLNSLFAGLAKEAWARGHEIEKGIIPEQTANGIKAEVYFNYRVKYNQKGLLSVVFSDYQYSGGAHGITVQSSYTFDLKTGKEYKLKDLFKESTDYISVINGEVKKQMEEKDTTVLLTPFVSIKDDQDFYLSNNAIVVYFQQYEYFPYAYGIPEFYIDFSL